MLLRWKSIMVNKVCSADVHALILTEKEIHPGYITCVRPPQRIALSDMTRSEINELLEKLGFYKKAQPEDEVPEEFRFSPAKDSPFKDEPAYKPSTSTPATENASSEPNAEVKHTDL